MPVTPTGTKKPRSGWSMLIGSVILCFVLFIIFGWPKYLDRFGTVASGAITDKYENIRILSDNWTRSFEVIATYSIPGQLVQHRAACYVDDKTYDSLHAGDRVTVHYFAALLQQPFIPATDLSVCRGAASLGFQSGPFRLLVILFAPILLMLFLWRLLHLKIFVWAVLLWLAFAFVYVVVPRVEPSPQNPVVATARIHYLVTIKTLGGTNTYRSIQLSHPYQIVVLEYAAPGMDTPVKAVDKVDLGSVPDLQEGKRISIVYDSANPRIARLEQGTRMFPGQARTTVILLGGAYVLLITIGATIGGLFRRVVRWLSRAARENLARGPNLINRSGPKSSRPS